MEYVPNKELLVVEGDNCRTVTQYQRKSFVSHANAEIGNLLIRDESRVVRKHVVGSARVRHNEGSCDRNDG